MILHSLASILRVSADPTDPGCDRAGPLWHQSIGLTWVQPLKERLDAYVQGAFFFHLDLRPIVSAIEVDMQPEQPTCMARTPDIEAE